MFFDTAAQMALESTGLDAAMVLMPAGDRWTSPAAPWPRPEFGIAFDVAAVELVRTKPDVWRRPPRVIAADGMGKPTRCTAESIVVAPVRNDAGEIDRRRVRRAARPGRQSPPRHSHAGSPRRRADRRRGRASAWHGASRRSNPPASRCCWNKPSHPQWPNICTVIRKSLGGQTRDVTMLFADLRGFTKIADDLPPADAYDLLAAVMETLTRAIMDHGGVVIDYYGDGVSAMWNAPLDVPDHADRACAAALQMLDALPAVSRAVAARSAATAGTGNRHPRGHGAGRQRRHAAAAEVRPARQRREHRQPRADGGQAAERIAAGNRRRAQAAVVAVRHAQGLHRAAAGAR